MNFHNAVDFLLEGSSPSSYRISWNSLAAAGSIGLVPKVLFGPDSLHVGDCFFESYHKLLVGYESFQMRTMVEVAEIQHSEHSLLIIWREFSSLSMLPQDHILTLTRFWSFHLI